jgi:hypothetical protein
MNNPLSQTAIASLLALGIGIGGTYFVVSKKQTTLPASSMSLNQAMRTLWSDHVIWTRQYIVSAIADLPDVGAAAKRLMKNQEDIGNAVTSFYGAQAGNALTALFKDHITIATKVVKYAQDGDKKNLTIANDEWHKNADDIATFLSSANPNWPKDAVQKMLYEHLKLTTQEAVARLGQQWDKDIATFDQIYTQILEMADTLTNGIVAQFPERF